ncbi:MAG: HI0074 family nucleotidyltransferase substrate-binding subunit [Alphaproteobacteria bacterium]|nr:HI0074 family nucleotidyltransferase substrate-binding subunit [Alphaproteobacteria bacterium]
MTDPKLDLGPLKRAIDRLSEGWSRYQQDTTDVQIRDGLIQRFEFTYEISHKMLKRCLEAMSANPVEFDDMGFQDLIPSGHVQNLLLGAWPQWKLYCEMRAKTSHTYDEDVALEAFGSRATG